MAEVNWKWEIHEFFLETLRSRAAALAHSAKVTIDGQEYNYPISKVVIRDGFFKLYVEIEDEPFGNIEKAVVVDVNQVPLMSGEGIIEKGYEGWHLAFKVYVKSEIEKGEDQ